MEVRLESDCAAASSAAEQEQKDGCHVLPPGGGAGKVAMKLALPVKALLQDRSEDLIWPFDSELAPPKAGSAESGEEESLRRTAARSRTGALVVVPPGLAPADLPSRGSVLHAAGECQPCAWFWRPGSCHNERECCHCHLCPEGEIKSRKKNKHTMMRLGLATPKPGASLDADTNEPRKVSFAMGHTRSEEGPRSRPDTRCEGAATPEPPALEAPVAPGPADPPPASGAPPPVKLALPLAARSTGAFRPLPAALTQDGFLQSDSGEGSAASEGAAFEDFVGAFPPGLMPPASVPSRGSQLHASGDCRPCAWFWRPGSCQNERDCGHCHLCGEGELKARKKQKRTMLRLGLATPKPAAEQPGAAEVLHRALRLAAEGQSCLRRTEGASTPVGDLDPESTTASGSEQDDDAFRALRRAASPGTASEEDARPVAKSRVGDLVRLPPGLQAPPGTPSHGSSLHRVGNCWPCASFWKPGGCQSGRDCGRCHLCPAGELEFRRSSKQAMMRLGLATPKASRDEAHHLEEA